MVDQPKVYNTLGFHYSKDRVSGIAACARMQGDDPGPEYGGLDDASAPFQHGDRNGGVVPFTLPRSPSITQGLAGPGGEPHDATIRVLLIEGDPDDGAMVEQLLGRAENTRFVLHRNADHEEGLHRLLGGEHDAALVGHGPDAGDSLHFAATAARRGVR